MALEGDEEGCWPGLTPLVFVCTSGTEGFFILACAGGGLDATTAAIVNASGWSRRHALNGSEERARVQRILLNSSPSTLRRY